MADTCLLEYAKKTTQNNKLNMSRFAFKQKITKNRKLDKPSLMMLRLASERPLYDLDLLNKKPTKNDNKP